MSPWRGKHLLLGVPCLRCTPWPSPGPFYGAWGVGRAPGPVPFAFFFCTIAGSGQAELEPRPATLTPGRWQSEQQKRPDESLEKDTLRPQAGKGTPSRRWPLGRCVRAGAFPVLSVHVAAQKRRRESGQCDFGLLAGVGNHFPRVTWISTAFL